MAYTLAVLGDITKRRKESIDFLGIWNAQKVDPGARKCHRCRVRGRERDVIQPPQHFQHFEWCKKEACWTRIQARSEAIANLLPPEFYDRLVRRMIRQRL